jgi:ATP-dependent protease HslVU (ClpYQ) ATPase subunit
MVSIQGPNLNQLINQAVYSAMSSGTKAAQNANAATSEIIYDLFFKNVKTKTEFKDKIKKTLSKLNSALKEGEVDDILNSLETKDQPPFCASYTEEGVSEQLHLQDNLARADIYDILHHFYSKLYDEADKKIG